MKKILAALMVGASTLAGCSTVPATDPTAIVAETSAVVQQIIAGTIQACSYQPDAAAVEALLASFVPGAAPTIAIASQVISAICAQVTSMGAARYGHAYGVPVINGIPITGHFVLTHKRYRHRYYPTGRLE